MQRGGRRPGAGRKKGSKDKRPRISKDVKELACQLWQDRMGGEIETLIAATLRAIKAERPDSRILIHALDRIMGPVVKTTVIGVETVAPLFVLPSDRLPDFGNRPRAVEESNAIKAMLGASVSGPESSNG